MTQPTQKFRCGLPLLAFTAATFLGLGGVAGFYLKDHFSTTAARPAPTAFVSAEADKDEIPEKAQGAVRALKQFLAATTVDERLRYTLYADTMKPLMERYYRQVPKEPVTVDRIKFVRIDPNPTLGTGSHCILNLESKSWEFSVPVMLEEQTDGFKLDWVAFVEFKDRLLEKFFWTYQEEPMRFHVGIQRMNYLGNEVPDVAEKDCFRVISVPSNFFQGHVHLEKGSDLAKKLRESMPWETHMWVVAELVWKKQGAQQWVELKEMPQMHWYALPEEQGAVPPKR